MSHHYTPEGYAAQFAKEDTVAQDPNGQPIQPEQPPFHGQHPSGQWGQPSPDMNQYPPHYQPPGYFGQPIPPGPGYAHPGQQMHSGYYPRIMLNINISRQTDRNKCILSTIRLQINNIIHITMGIIQCGDTLI